MGQNKSRAWNSSLESRSIEEWTEYDNFIRAQVSEMTSSNIKGLQCLRSANTITYKESMFDRFSGIIKGHIHFTGRFSNSVESIEPSLTKVFKDPKAVFLPNLIALNGSIGYREFKLYSNGKNNDDQIYLIDLEIDFKNSLKLLDGGYNHILDTIEEKNKDIIKEEYKELVGSILETCNQNKTVCGIAIAERSIVYGTNQSHGIATLFYLEDGVYHCCVYDPMYYSKKDSNYVFAVNSFYILFYYIGKIFNIPVKVINLSSYCYIQEGKGIRCPQYVIDAEYCYIFSLYFIFSYAKNGFPHDEAGLRKSVTDSYIVEPSELKRNPCVETNKFRIIFISFLLTVLTIISDDLEVLIFIKNFYDEMKLDYYININNNTKRTSKQSYTILEPSILNLLDIKISTREQNEFESRTPANWARLQEERGITRGKGGSRSKITRKKDGGRRRKTMRNKSAKES